MYEFDNRSDCLHLDYDFRITEVNFDKLISFIKEHFLSIGEFCMSPLSGYYNYSINFNIDDEYCCFSVYNNCLTIRRIYIPDSKRHKGFFRDFLSSLELLLPELGITAICIDNIQNKELLDFLISKEYIKAYFNYPKPMSPKDFSMPDAYKILNN